MSNLGIKGRTPEQESRYNAHKAFAERETDMKSIMMNAIRSCGIENAELHAKNPPVVEIHIEERHSDAVAQELKDMLDGSTGVMYEFIVILVPRIEAEGITFVRG